MSAVLDQLPVSIPKENALEVFTTVGAIDKYLDMVRAEIDGFSGDVQTKKGRDAIASIAYKVAKSKTYLDGVGKELTDSAKELPKKRSEEHTSELQSLMRISYAVFCVKKIIQHLRHTEH